MGAELWRPRQVIAPTHLRDEIAQEAAALALQYDSVPDVP